MDNDTEKKVPLKDTVRICKLCGKEFVPKMWKQQVCKGPHYSNCPICGKQLQIKNTDYGTTTCSKECMKELKIRTARAKGSYAAGVIKNKQTCLERYGVEHYSSLAECKEKVKATNLEKFGTEWANQNEEIKAKMVQGLISKYGVDNAFKAPEVKQKIKEVLTEKYGGIGVASPVLREKIFATNIEKYGYASPAKALQCKQKAKETIRERFGYDSYTSSKEGLTHLMKDLSKIDNFWEFRKDPEKYIRDRYETKPYVDELAAELGVNETSVYDILIRMNCKDAIDRSRTSIIERQVYEFLLTLLPKSEIIQCDRRTITPLELDFYLPRYEFAIECDPTFTHNSTVCSFGDEPPKSTVYHRDKTNKAEEKGIFLFHIFGYDWEFKQEIVKSMITSALGLTKTKFYARNTIIKEVDYNTSCSFLDTNHRQGSASSSIRLGLFDKHTDQLLSIMTFGKLRNTIGKQNNSPDNSYELIRFCNVLNTTVVGGASKLFKHFIKRYNPKMVMSFSDRAHTRGNLYPELGFKEVRRSDPNYVWVNMLNEDYYNRVACQKHNLPKLFDDVTQSDLDTKSEKDIMVEHGYAQVYDSGSIRWEYYLNT